VTVVLPHHFKDGVGEVASGVQVLENDEALKVAAEALEAKAAALEALLGGVKFKVGLTASSPFSGGISETTLAHGLGKTPTFACAVAIKEINSGGALGTEFYGGVLTGVSAINGTNATFTFTNGAAANGASFELMWLVAG
jgi:hypothetical protein